MKPRELQAALARLAPEKIGLNEAAALFAIAEKPLTAPEVAKLCNVKPTLMRVRFIHLVDKGLVDRTIHRRGKVMFFLSESGKKLVNNVLGNPQA